jgi:hypothetical protein
MRGAFTLDIAGVRIKVSLPAAWLPGLTKRYGEFLSAQPAPWHLAVLHDPAVDSNMPGEVDHDGPQTRFHVATYRGTINLATQDAHVTTASEANAASAVERAASYILMQVLPREHSSLWLHAAGIIRNGYGYVFFGKSGAGKTTIASLAPQDADILCDENIVVSLTPGGAALHSTPFWGHSTPPHLIHRHKVSAPLAGLFALEHGSVFRLDPLSPAEAVAALLDTEKVATERVDSALAWLAIAANLVACPGVRRLTFRPETTLWEFLSSQGT